MKITKKQIMEWLDEKYEKYAGQYMDAEERGNDDAMERAGEKTDNIDEISSLLEDIK